MHLRLTGCVTSKARPRVYKGRGVLPLKYRLWKECAIAELWLQCKTKVTATEVHVILVGKHNRKNDADNQIGSILDALVQAQILIDDSLIHINKISLELRYCKNTEPYVLIELR